ncbi:MAG: hypothetical protein L0Y71_16675 [Gemmataceae bacterium]|nr:hypothetical protein [Gemmataceae bacterium]
MFAHLIVNPRVIVLSFPQATRAGMTAVTLPARNVASNSIPPKRMQGTFADYQNWTVPVQGVGTDMDEPL